MDTDNELLAGDLLADLSQVTAWLVGRLEAGAALDAYLLAAGAAQVVEDHQHRDAFALRRAAEYLGDRNGGAGVRRIAPLLRGGASVAEFARRLPPADRRAAEWLAGVTGLRDRLATHIATGSPAGEDEWRTLAGRARLLQRLSAGLPATLRRDVLRLPACFRSFNQHPTDVTRLVGAFAGRYPDRARRVLVVGVRTSGSYLAPLASADLVAAGYQNVDTLTVRPGRPLRRGERSTLRAAVAAAGTVAVIDDPPVTGAALRKTLGALTRYGVPEQSLTLLLPLFDSTVPPVLRGYPHVTLPHQQWAVQAQLTSTAVQAALAQLTGSAVAHVERLPLGDTVAPPARGQVAALFRISWAGPATQTRLVLARGVGLGYLGRHALAVTRAVGEYMPEVYGVCDGLLYRAWLPEEQRLCEARPASGAHAEAIAAYVAARAAALPAASDRSLRLAGQQPVWEVASMLLAEAFGRLGLPLRPLLLDAAVRRLTAVARPSVIDGDMRASRWFVDPAASERLRKIDPDLRAFSNLDLACYDPVFDLAGVDPGGPRGGLEMAVRARYEAGSGARIDDERWLCYELVHAWDRARTGLWSGRAATRASARAVQRYLAAGYLADLEPPAGGPLAALDVDGVLESDSLGFSATTRDGASALRALTRHGYRPVLVTGRSLDEVRERCGAYQLAGGVAEYGAAIYDHATGSTVEVLNMTDRADLDRLRDVLRAMPGVHLDADYTYAVRAFRYDDPDRGGGERRGLDPDTVAAALARAGHGGQRIRVIPGEAQTDFTAARIDKGTGLRTLARLLGGPAGPVPVALAVGDTAADLPMLALAELACAPAQATRAVRTSGVRVLGRPYQAGLAAAVSVLLGHRPGTCPTCRGPDPTPQARLLLTVLSAAETGRWGIPRAALHTAHALAHGRPHGSQPQPSGARRDSVSACPGGAYASIWRRR